MPTRLVATRIKPSEIQQHDHVTFDYAAPNEHPPTRVGEVVGFRGNPHGDNYCVVLWDYSLYDGPGPRSYHMNKLRGLSRIDDVNIDTTGTDPLTKFQLALQSFRRMFGRGDAKELAALILKKLL